MKELTTGFENTRCWETKYNKMFRGHKTLDLYYEDLAEDVVREFARVTDFLGLGPHRPASTLKKQNPETSSILIKNYAELKTAFAGSEWEDFFDE